MKTDTQKSGRISALVKTALYEVESVRKIVPTDPRDDLSFEIDGISQVASSYGSDIELAREISKYFTQSFGGGFPPSHFVNAASKIILGIKEIQAGESNDI